MYPTHAGSAVRQCWMRLQQLPLPAHLTASTVYVLSVIMTMTKTDSVDSTFYAHFANKLDYIFIERDTFQIFILKFMLVRLCCFTPNCMQLWF